MASGCLDTLAPMARPDTHDLTAKVILASKDRLDLLIGSTPGLAQPE